MYLVATKTYLIKQTIGVLDHLAKEAKDISLDVADNAGSTCQGAGRIL